MTENKSKLLNYLESIKKAEDIVQNQTLNDSLLNRITHQYKIADEKNKKWMDENCEFILNKSENSYLKFEQLEKQVITIKNILIFFAIIVSINIIITLILAFLSFLG